MHPDDFDDDNEHDENYTFASNPPERKRPQPRSFWNRVWIEARRRPHVWLRVRRVFVKATAQQLASDIRNL